MELDKELGEGRKINQTVPTGEGGRKGLSQHKAKNIPSDISEMKTGIPV